MSASIETEAKTVRALEGRFWDEPGGTRARANAGSGVCQDVNRAPAGTSTSNQMDVIREVRQRRNLRIVREYSDEGKSGLNIQGRDSLAQMIADVQAGGADYASILVYDVSRWGRFQDADESAHYEYICRQAGSLCITARSSSRTTAARSPPSSRG